MRRRLSVLSALPVVMALAIAPSAFADESGARERFNLRGTAFSDLTSLERLQDLAEQAEAEQAETLQSATSRRDAALLSMPDRPTGSATAWQQRFTMAPAGTMASVWGEQAEQFRFSAGERWGISLGISQRMRGQAFELQDVSAGAFYSLTDRVRIGGEFRFTSPEEDVFGEEADRRTPQLRFESAFRF